MDARNQTVHRFAIGWEDFAARSRIGLQLLTERALHVAATEEGLSEAIGIGGRKRGHEALRRRLTLFPEAAAYKSRRSDMRHQRTTPEPPEMLLSNRFDSRGA